MSKRVIAVIARDRRDLHPTSAKQRSSRSPQYSSLKKTQYDLVNMARHKSSLKASTLSWHLFCHQYEWIATAAEQKSRPYARAEENARALNGRFGMTTLERFEK